MLSSNAIKLPRKTEGLSPRRKSMSIKQNIFENYREFSTEIAGRTFTFEYGKWPDWRMLHYSAAVTRQQFCYSNRISASREGIDYFPSPSI